MVFKTSWDIKVTDKNVREVLEQVKTVAKDLHWEVPFYWARRLKSLMWNNLERRSYQGPSHDTPISLRSMLHYKQLKKGHTWVGFVGLEREASRGYTYKDVLKFVEEGHAIVEPVRGLRRLLGQKYRKTGERVPAKWYLRSARQVFASKDKKEVLNELLDKKEAMSPLIRFNRSGL